MGFASIELEFEDFSLEGMTIENDNLTFILNGPNDHYMGPTIESKRTCVPASLQLLRWTRSALAGEYESSQLLQGKRVRIYCGPAHT